MINGSILITENSFTIGLLITLLLFIVVWISGLSRRLLLKLPRGTLKKQEPLQNAKSPNLKVLMRKLN